MDAHNITISAVYTWHHFKAAPIKLLPLQAMWQATGKTKREHNSHIVQAERR